MKLMTAYYNADRKYYKPAFRRLWGKKASKKARHKRAHERWANRFSLLLASAYSKDSE